MTWEFKEDEKGGKKKEETKEKIGSQKSHVGFPKQSSYRRRQSHPQKKHNRCWNFN